MNNMQSDNYVFKNNNMSFSIDLMARFYDLVPRVFNPDGTVKPHTKELRKELIKVCTQINRTGTPYGDVRTGEMNEYNVKKLIDIFSR